MAKAHLLNQINKSSGSLTENTEVTIDNTKILHHQGVKVTSVIEP